MARAHGRSKPRSQGKFLLLDELEGEIEVSVDFHGDEPEKIAEVLKGAGAKIVRTK